MTNDCVISIINAALHKTTACISIWLGKILRQISKDWWQECVR